MNRRSFLKQLGIAGLAISASACQVRQRLSSPLENGVALGDTKTLKILQQTHFVPAYDEWFDKEFALSWGQKHGIEVLVDHIPFGGLYARAAGEVANLTGHDIVAFVSPPAAFEDKCVDMRDVVSNIESSIGKVNDIGRLSCMNQKTNKWYGVPDFWAPLPLLWRKDLWEEAEPGSSPSTWEDVLRVGRRLKKMGAPLGIGFSAELDSNCSLRSLLYAYGASVQNEAAQVVINSPKTVEALKMGLALFKETNTPEVLAWSASSNNSFMVSGKGAMIANAISALRTIEKKNPELAQNILLAPPPSGPAGQLAPANIASIYSIWKFSPNIELAKQFIQDLILGYKAAYERSETYNLPAFPGSVPDYKTSLEKDPVGIPYGKYAMLADAEKWTTNIGNPGWSNAAENEVFDQYLIPKMFSLVAQGTMTPEGAAQWAEAAITPIFKKWNERQMI